MRQRRQLPSHFSVQERVHALAISYKISACMHKVNYITMRDLTHTIQLETSWLGKDSIVSLQSVEGKVTYIFVDILYIYTKCALFSYE